MNPNLKVANSLQSLGILWTLLINHIGWYKTNTRVESQYKIFWQTLVATFRPFYPCEKATKFCQKFLYCDSTLPLDATELVSQPLTQTVVDILWLSEAFWGARVESQYKNFWQNLVATFCPLFTWRKGTKCGDQVSSKIFVLWFYSSRICLQYFYQCSCATSM